MHAYQVGDKVYWESQAQGSWVRKEGEVVEVVPAGRYPSTEISNDGKPRNETSYIVALPPGPRGGKRKLYWPRTAALKPL